MNYGMILDVALQLIAVFMAIVFHEVAHGYMALRLGDPTAKNLGRLTLNPLAHIDPIGTILVPAVMILLTGMGFGWAKPVPVNPRYFRNPFRGMLFVALAGPGTNIALALGATLVGQLLLLMVPSTSTFAASSFGVNLLMALFTVLAFLVLYNLFFAVLNLVPIPPLDGSRVLTYFLPTEGRRIMLQMERYGFIIVVGLFYFHVLDGLFRAATTLALQLLGERWIGLVFR
ncbi:site-2 protease family protein [Candidatus Bipolaricaulota bacterium]|nr:site-2 protease family protein [Candidatus Bipolaricaulota bacterium]